MAKTLYDLAFLVESILKPEVREDIPANGFADFLTKSWEGLRIGIVESTWGSENEEKWGSAAVV
jgi:amidase